MSGRPDSPSPALQSLGQQTFQHRQAAERETPPDDAGLQLPASLTFGDAEGNCSNIVCTASYITNGLGLRYLSECLLPERTAFATCAVSQMGSSRGSAPEGGLKR